MDFWDLIGFIASCLGACTFFPEVARALKSHRLNDIAWGMLLLVNSSSFLWLVYAIRFELNPIIFSSTINIILSSILIFLKVNYSRSSKQVLETVTEEITDQE